MAQLKLAWRNLSWKRYPILAAIPVVAMAMLFAAVVSVQAAHNQEYFVNQAADTLRQVIGDQRVSNLEDKVFRVKLAVVRLAYWGHARTNPEVARMLEMPLPPATPDVDAGGAPPAIAPLVIGQPLRREGQWRAFGPPANGMWRTEVRTSVADYWEDIDLVALDLRRLSVRFVPGTDATGDAQASRIPPADDPHVVAVFNGGFRPGYDSGIRKAGVEIGKLHDNMASIIMTTGTVTISSWDPAAVSAWQTADVRQNLQLLLDGGIFHSPFSSSRSNLSFKTYRSALGISADERWLIYACGSAASPQEIAAALRLASCDKAVHLDMNAGNVFFDAVLHEDHNLVYKPEEPEFHKYKIAQLTTGSRRDFFYVVAGSRGLAQTSKPGMN